MPIFILSLLSPINDITTSFESVPQFNSPITYQVEFIEIQKKLHPEIVPLTVNESAEAVYHKIRKLALAEPQWQVTVDEPEKFHLEAVATTPLMKFKDDIVIEVRSQNGQSLVNMRSRSRVGKSDLGANAKRISTFLKQIP